MGQKKDILFQKGYNEKNFFLLGPADGLYNIPPSTYFTGSAQKEGRSRKRIANTNIVIPIPGNSTNYIPGNHHVPRYINNVEPASLLLLSILPEKIANMPYMNNYSNSYNYRNSNRVLHKKGYRNRRFPTQLIRNGGRKTNYRTGGYNNVEYKFIDSASTATMDVVWKDHAPNNTLHNVAAGAGVDEHVGISYWLRSIHFRFYVLQPELLETNPNPDAIFRVVVVLDTQPNAAALVPGAVFATTGTDSLGFQNLENTGRYKVLHDFGPKTFKKIWESNAVANTFSWSRQKTRVFSWNKTFPGRGLKVETKVGGGGIGNINNNNISVIAINTNGALNNLFFNSRCRFTDN